ncbi:MAG: ABC transporter ATP-binding protein [Bacteroidetes bacterium]|nr:ABC transporter ATP-binding protein [Bacteroidota bacterium]
MRPILEIRNIGKKYKIQHLAGGYLSLRERVVNSFKFDRNQIEDFWALKEISFDVKPGESIGIIGRNGAGKSTLLKILSKITPPTTGHIISRGRIASLLEVGTGFHPELTGRENIFFNGSLLGMKRKEIEQKFDEIVDFSGVEKFLDTPLKHFSSGMQLRLAFAVAAFLEPEILIIDEVLAVGDAEFQKKCLSKMRGIRNEGKTLLFVSHNLEAVEGLCNIGVLLESGRITHIDNSISKIIGKYLSAFGSTSASENAEWSSGNGSPYNNDVHDFQNISLTTENNDVHGRLISFGSKIKVSMEVNIHVADPTLNFGYAVYNESNQIIYWSWAKDWDGKIVVKQPGAYKVDTLIPEKFINEGKYRLEVFSVLHGLRQLVAIGEGPSISFEIEGGYRSVGLSPVFKWNFNQLE